MAVIVRATFLLDTTRPEDQQILAELRATSEFRFNGDHYEAQSVRTSRKGVEITAKVVE